MAGTVLIVDDDPHIRDVITYALEAAGFACITAQDGAEAVSRTEDGDPDIVVLDINMPEMDGFEVCKELRKRSEVPILFLSSRDDEIDRIVGLEIGGDDYVAKPFSPRELVARVKVILKRQRAAAPASADAAEQAAVLTFGRLSLDPARFVAAFANAPVALTATEFAILREFLARPTFVRDRNAIIELAYPGNVHVSDRTVDSHIRHIRGKFQAVGCDNVIETVHGVGYRLGSCE
jgi:two-component system, OmpR family, response regulator